MDNDKQYRVTVTPVTKEEALKRLDALEPERNTILTDYGPKYPDIEVQLSGQDGNAFAIMGRCQQAMRTAHIDRDEIKKFIDECKEGDYDHLLQTCMKWLNVE